MRVFSNPGNPVDVDHLRRGMSYAFSYEQRKGRPGRGGWDFHNQFYRGLEVARQGGLTEGYWSYLVDRLWEWRALRPKPKAFIYDAGIANFRAFQQIYSQLAGDKDPGCVHFADLDWSHVEPLFEFAAALKGASRPTFPSKLCHFLFPSAFVVTDGLLVKSGWASYREYWTDCRQGWISHPDQDSLVAELKRALPRPAVATYPWPTKIVELCQFQAVS